jgi:chromosome segregation ATPase
MLKDDILRLLKEDEEFRYAVVGLLGLQRLEEAVIELKNVVIRMEERLAKVEERLEEHDRKFNAILAELRDFRKELSDLRSKHDKRLSNIEAYMERTSLTLEEEAREVIEYRLREKGIAITNISSLILEDMEIDIYATDTNLCLIGEAKTRVGVNVVEKVDKDIEKLCRDHPEYLKDKVIKVIYGMQVLPDAVDEARKRGIWLVTANKEITELNIR